MIYGQVRLSEVHDPDEYQIWSKSSLKYGPKSSSNSEENSSQKIGSAPCPIKGSQIRAGISYIKSNTAQKDIKLLVVPTRSLHEVIKLPDS